VTTDFAGGMKPDVNEEAVSSSLDIAAMDVYHGTQDHFDGSQQAMVEDYTRSLKHGNFLVAETNAQTTDWTSTFQYPPYDSQLRSDVYTHIANGANMVEYRRWASISANQETYWKGVLSHDYEPNRAYAEVSRTENELQRIGPQLAGMQLHNDVAILWSRDSLNAISFMPFTSSGPQWSFAPPTTDYGSGRRQVHREIVVELQVVVVDEERPVRGSTRQITSPQIHIGEAERCGVSGYSDLTKAVRYRRIVEAVVAVEELLKERALIWVSLMILLASSVRETRWVNGVVVDTQTIPSTVNETSMAFSRQARSHAMPMTTRNNPHIICCRK
jgi:beta-galactosidase GanA